MKMTKARSRWFIAALVVIGMQAAILKNGFGDPPPPASTTAQQGKPAESPAASETSGDEPDEPIVTTTVKRTPAEALSGAWKMLDTASHAGKSQMRIDAVNAIGPLGGFPQGDGMLRKALTDPDRDVRLAAVVAIGTAQDRRLLPDLHKTLDDNAPEVSYAAATVLWKMHDHAGQAVLFGVLGGERKAKSGLVGQGMHDANRDLHSPATLAMIGAEQGAGMLLGPFSIGLDAALLVHRGSSTTSARVLTATLIADDHSNATKALFMSVLHDKDYFVRGAAARGLGNFQGKDVSEALLPSFDDPKPAVRLVAAASYIRSSRPSKSKSPAPKPIPAH